MAQYIEFTPEQKEHAASVDLEEFLLRQGEKAHQVRTGKAARQRPQRHGSRLRVVRSCLERGRSSRQLCAKILRQELH